MAKGIPNSLEGQHQSRGRDIRLMQLAGRQEANETRSSYRRRPNAGQAALGSECLSLQYVGTYHGGWVGDRGSGIEEYEKSVVDEFRDQE
jgi:hypothetical protein